MAAGAEETRAKLLGYGKALLHFTCSNAIALVLLPLAAWTAVGTSRLCMHARSAVHWLLSVAPHCSAFSNRHDAAACAQRKGVEMHRSGQLQHVVHQLQTHEYNVTLVSKGVDTYELLYTCGH